MGFLKDLGKFTKATFKAIGDFAEFAADQAEEMLEASNRLLIESSMKRAQRWTNHFSVDLEASERLLCQQYILNSALYLNELEGGSNRELSDLIKATKENISELKAGNTLIYEIKLVGSIEEQREQFNSMIQKKLKVTR